MIERTLVLLKPDCVARMLAGKIITRFEDAGLKIVGMKFVWIDKSLSKEHYAEHVDKDFYPDLERYITEGPVIAIVLEGVNAVKIVRKMVGSTEPSEALPGTIRGDFAHVNREFANDKGSSIKNLIHASGTADEAVKEIDLYFEEPELHSYKTVHETHILAD